MNTIIPLKAPFEYYLLLLLLITYLVSIVKAFLNLNEIIKCLKTLSAYLSSASLFRSPYDAIGFHLEKKKNYDLCLNEVLIKFPIIEKYSGYYIGTLEYGASDISNYTVASKLFDILSMRRNYLYQNFKSAFNPCISIKSFFAIPSIVLDWLGFQPSIFFSRFFNLICWISAYLLGLYSEEIKVLLGSIVKNFI